MADNTLLNAGAGGDTIATDDIGGVKYQRVKVTFGVDGVAADVTATAPLPVELLNDIGRNARAFMLDAYTAAARLADLVTPGHDR